MPRHGRFSLSSGHLLLLLAVLLPYSTPAEAQGGGSSPWLTLSGREPAVIAKGGFSGLFPESSFIAYNFSNMLQLPSVTFWCNVQMTKDAVGLCLPNVNLQNGTSIWFPNSPYINQSKSYVINGKTVRGWFSVDYTYEQLDANVSLTRGISSRPGNYDGVYLILTVEGAGRFGQSLWLNIEHDVFYSQHNVNITRYVVAVARTVNVTYISSPEEKFLRNIAPAFKDSMTKLIFCIPEDQMMDPSTNKTYESYLTNLTFIRTFASGILISKNFIWPVTSGPDIFLKSYRSIVTDAHKDGLEVFASGFGNDFIFAYNYSYNPVSEYLKFIDNEKFSVDGFLSDFPSTAWEAIRCFSHLGNDTRKSKSPVVITHNGDSGNYPACTDLAYAKAIEGGADVIDCPVQLTKDGSLVCLSNIDLQKSTSAVNSPFGTRLSKFPDIQGENGIFSFNLTWSEIKELKPELLNTFQEIYDLKRNPANQNAGEFIDLAGFLSLAKDKNVSGVMISVENADFLVEKLRYDIIGNIMLTLNMSGYNNQTAPQVMIQSPNRSTLIPFKQVEGYHTVYKLDELVRDVDLNALNDIKTFSDAVSVRKSSIFRSSEAFLTENTTLVNTLHSAGLKVYVYVLMNEFVSIPWDFFGDAMVEIHNYFEGAGIDGVITDFPATAGLYRRNRCSERGYNISLVQPGFLINKNIMPEDSMPPVLDPLPKLKASDVAEPPLPPASSEPRMPRSPPGATDSGSPGKPIGTGYLGAPSLPIILATSLFMLL